VVDDLVLGRFLILERIGSGGMGTVYRALDERLRREVAVKEIPARNSDRVVREAKAAARLNHPTVVALYEFGIEGDSAFLVSELADGDPLDHLVSAGGLTDRDVAEAGLDVCDALAHAHERGVIHRDVKPANVMVVHDGTRASAKLMDFGIAALVDEDRLTATGEMVGTLAYMAPEQADGEDADEAGDVYSLALTLYECWAGINPVAAGSPAATARRLGQSVPSLARLRTDLPSDLTEVVDDCLVADPRERPTLDELADVIAASAAGLDGEHLLPARDEELGERRRAPGRAARIAAAVALGVSLCVLAGPAHLGGLALVLAVLCLPALILAAAIERSAIPVLAPALGAVGAALAYPALAGRRGRGVERAGLGALGWLWLATASVALGIGPRLGIGPSAHHGWTRSADAAAHQVLAPLADPHSLAAALAFAAAAWAMGPILRTRHAALALVWAVLWSAGLTAVLHAACPPVAASPLIAFAAAAVMIWLEHRDRVAEPRGRRLFAPFGPRATARTAPR